MLLERHWYIPTNCCVIDLIVKFLVWMVSDATPFVCAVIGLLSFVHLYAPDITEQHGNINICPNLAFLTLMK